MPQARINGLNVEVSQEVTDNDVIYTISGEGAAQLYESLKTVHTNPSEIKDGAFTVNKSALRSPFMDSPWSKAVESKLAAAASKLEVK